MTERSPEVAGLMAQVAELTKRVTIAEAEGLAREDIEKAVVTAVGDLRNHHPRWEVPDDALVNSLVKRVMGCLVGEIHNKQQVRAS